MSKQHGMVRGWALATALCLVATMAAAQQPPSAAAPQTQAPSAGKITPEQARQLFGLVDELIKFSSEETGLPIKSQVKRQITSRAAVESYLKEKFEEDESAKRMQRSEIVLKKFGLLDRDFALKPFCWRCSRSRSRPTTTPRPRPSICWTGWTLRSRSRCWRTS